MRTTIPTVKIVLDRERTLRFDFNALASFEEQSGRSALDPAVWNSPDAKTLRALLWAAMLHEDEALTIKAVGAMIHAGNVSYVSEKIQEASAASNPEPSGDNGEGSDPNA